jgi:hypothetical protein
MMDDTYLFVGYIVHPPGLSEQRCDLSPQVITFCNEFEVHQELQVQQLQAEVSPPVQLPCRQSLSDTQHTTALINFIMIICSCQTLEYTMITPL